MSFRSDALQIKNETTDGANTATRVGGLFESIASVTDTVDTISDLRQYDTSQLSEGDLVRVKAHNSNGVSKGYGEGVFEWINTPIFQTVESSLGYRGSIEVTELTKTLVGDGNPDSTDEYYGDELVLSNDAKVTVVSAQQGSLDNTIRSYGIGETDIRLALESGTITSGLDAYMDDDNGFYIRPTYDGFSGAGHWQRVLSEDGFVTPEMYGAVGYDSIRNTDSPINSHQGLQDAFDSMFPVKILPRSYYTDQKIFVRRPKLYNTVGHTVDLVSSTVNKGRYFKILEGKNAGRIYTDLDIHVLEIRSPCVLNVSIDCQQVTDHTKSGIRINANDRVKGYIEASVAGNPESLGPDLSTGTTGILVDQTDPEVSRDHFSSSGAISGINIKLSASACYCGYHLTPKDPDVQTFVNGIKVHWGMDRVKRPIWTEYGCDVSEFVGIYQSRDDLLSTTEQGEIPIVDVSSTSGSYFDVFGWDMVGTGRHNQLLRVGGGSMNDAGPMMLQDNMWKQGNYTDSSTKETFNLRSRISGDKEIEPSRLRYIPKVVKKTITSAELADLHNTPIEILGSSSDIDAVQVIAAHGFIISGTSEFSGEVRLRANTGGVGYVAASFEISDLSTNGTWRYDLGVSTRQGQLTNSSGSGSAILLDATSALSGAGDTDLELVVLYRTSPFDQP